MTTTPLRVCTQCGFTHAEFLARGLLGCAECYVSFGEALFADLLHLHPDLYLRPVATDGISGTDAEEIALDQNPAQLRERFSDALRHERYEEAAALRRRLRDLGLDTLS